ncbi:MAG: hypothetical protein RIC87_21265 [Kiloniellales bacterium]
MRSVSLLATLALVLGACAGSQTPGGVAITGIGETPTQPSSDQVVLAMQERLEREPMLLCPGVSLTSSCEWIEKGDQSALFPPEIGIRVASPVPLAGVELDAKPQNWEICYRLEGSDTLYVTRLSAQELGISPPKEGYVSAGLSEPYLPTTRAFHMGDPGYDAVAHRCDEALTNRGQKARAW